MLDLCVPLFWLDIPIREQQNRSSIQVDWMPLILPHQLYHHLFETWILMFNIFPFTLSLNILNMGQCWSRLGSTCWELYIPPESKESKKLLRDEQQIQQFWDHCCNTGFLPANHPGRGSNPVGIYGDDCRYSKAGEKLVVIHWNVILQKAKSPLVMICL